MKYFAICLPLLFLAGCASESENPFAAVDANHTAALSSYLDSGGDPNAQSPNGQSLLYIATGPHGGESVLRVLLEHGANPNVGAGSYTPLMNASSWCWLKGVSLLVEAGADVTARNGSGQTALQTVCSGGGDREKVVAYLQGRGL